MSCAAPAIQSNAPKPVGSAITSTRCVSTDYRERDATVIKHLPLVRAIACRVRESLPVQVELDDLVHAGILGLFDAVQKYDPSKKVVFHLYAKHRIRGAILDSLRQLDWASRDLRKRHKQIEAMTQRLSSQLGRVPSESELAREMGVSLTRWRKLVLELHSAGLGSSQCYPGTSTAESLERFSPVETQRSAEEPPDHSCARQQLREVLTTAIQGLPARYQRVVTLYYDQGSSMKQIGAELGVNESRISQIHKAALEKLHAALLSQGIQAPEVILES